MFVCCVSCPGAWLRKELLMKLMKWYLPTLYHPLDEVLHAGNHLHNDSWFRLGNCHVFKKIFAGISFQLSWFETSIGSTGESGWYDDDWEKEEKASTHPQYLHIQYLQYWIWNMQYLQYSIFARGWHDDWDKKEKASTHPSFGHSQYFSHQELVRQIFVTLTYVLSHRYFVTYHRYMEQSWKSIASTES